MFITIEGVDGAGKTTIADMLSKHYPNSTYLARKAIPDMDAGLRLALTHLNKSIWSGVDFVEEPIDAMYWYFKLLAWYTAFDKCSLRPALRTFDYVFIDGWVYRHIIKTAMRSGNAVEELSSMARHLTKPDKSIFLRVRAEECWPRRTNYAHHEMGYWDGFNDMRPSVNYCAYQREVQTILLDHGQALGWDVVNCEGLPLQAVFSEVVLAVDNRFELERLFPLSK